MPHIDFDARRKLLEPMTVTANEHEYTLPLYIPATMVPAIIAISNAREDPKAAVAGQRSAYAALFGEAVADQAMIDFSDDDFLEIIRALGATPGESSASDVSSTSTGTQPRPISSASTT